MRTLRAFGLDKFRLKSIGQDILEAIERLEKDEQLGGAPEIPTGHKGGGT